MRQVGERRHVFHVPVTWNLDEGGGGSGGSWDGGGVHPGCSGFGEVGRLDLGVKGSKIWLGIVGTERRVCFRELLVERHGRKKKGSELVVLVDAP